MRVLFIGDINASSGREITSNVLQGLRNERAIDLVIANGENAAHGLGITPKVADELFGMGIDVLTGGNHLYDRKEIYDYLPSEPRLLRPANYPPGVPGSSGYHGEAGGIGFYVTTLVGRTFMPNTDCPFRTLDRLLDGEAADTPVRIVDFHAEATSEKVALGRHADGRVSALIGTHTHVQTADEQVLPGGTAYISDVGMTGPHDGVIGVKAELVVQRFLTGMPTRFEPAEGNVQFHAVLVEIDARIGHALSIERIRIEDE